MPTKPSPTARSNLVTGELQPAFMPTPKGHRACILAARYCRRHYGTGLHYMRYTYEDGSFNFSVWRGMDYIGALAGMRPINLMR